MLVNEKELNCNLLDQLSILERIERQLKKSPQSREFFTLNLINRVLLPSL